MTSFCKAKTRKRVSILVLPVPSSRSQKPEMQRRPEKRPEQRSIRKNERNADRHRPPARIRGQRETQKQSQGQKHACEQACCYDTSTECTETSDNDYEMQIVEELHLARSNRQLHVKVEKSYGELTSMDVDPADESATIALSQKQQQDLLIVLDTNVLLSHLDFVKRIRSHGLGALGFPTMLVLWVALQELDSLKSRKLSKASCGLHLHLPEEPGAASLEPVHAASVSRCLLNVEDNDDLVLQCCLQYKTLYPEGTIMLCT
ncbi:transcriptional protein SWT1 isoform X3 [Ictalurus punctatus]|nr:transcriptional protein SWT1 isoform X3 [Ictalurus punctatus]